MIYLSHVATSTIFNYVGWAVLRPKIQEWTCMLSHLRPEGGGGGGGG